MDTNTVIPATPQPDPTLSSRTSGPADTALATRPSLWSPGFPTSSGGSIKYLAAFRPSTAARHTTLYCPIVCVDVTNTTDDKNAPTTLSSHYQLDPSEVANVIDMNLARRAAQRHKKTEQTATEPQSSSSMPSADIRDRQHTTRGESSVNVESKVNVIPGGDYLAGLAKSPFPVRSRMVVEESNTDAASLLWNAHGQVSAHSILGYDSFARANQSGSIKSYNHRVIVFSQHDDDQLQAILDHLTRISQNRENNSMYYKADPSTLSQIEVDGEIRFKLTQPPDEGSKDFKIITDETEMGFTVADVARIEASLAELTLANTTEGDSEIGIGDHASRESVTSQQDLEKAMAQTTVSDYGPQALERWQATGITSLVTGDHTDRSRMDPWDAELEMTPDGTKLAPGVKSSHPGVQNWLLNREITGLEGLEGSPNFGRQIL